MSEHTPDASGEQPEPPPSPGPPQPAAPAAHPDSPYARPAEPTAGQPGQPESAYARPADAAGQAGQPDSPYARPTDAAGQAGQPESAYARPADAAGQAGHGESGPDRPGDLHGEPAGPVRPGDPQAAGESAGYADSGYGQGGYPGYPGSAQVPGGGPQYGATLPSYPQPGGAGPGTSAIVHSNLPHYAAQQSPPRRRGGLATVVIALLAGLIGGLLGGSLITRSGGDLTGGGSPNALDTSAPASTPQQQLPPGSVEQVAQKLLPSVVSLQFTSASASGEGSGVVLSGDGMILTNNHVVEAGAQGAKLSAEFYDGRTAAVRIVGRAPDADLAVVQAVGVSGLTPAELGNSSGLVVGQQVVAIGSPFQLSGTVTGGIVSALRRPARVGGENGDQSTVLDTVQTDAAINPGNSGGPLVDIQGRVVAINSAIYSPNSGGLGQQQGGSVGVGFAIPIDQARRIADELRRTGRATMAVLNVTVRPNGPAQIIDVTAGGPGAKAGIKAGEVVVKVGDRRVENGDGLIAAVRSHSPGETVKLALTDSSGGNPHTVDVTLGSQDIGATR